MNVNINEFNPESLVTFWFSERVSALWYHSNPEFDREVEQKFSAMYQAATKGLLESWKVSAEGCLALIILFDQYPLNVFRNNAKSFATEQQAITIAQFCINQKLDIQLTKAQRSFIYMPFMHSEDIKQQELALTLFAALDAENLKYANHHFEIIKKFGRFPHRNKILERNNSTEEEIYLASKEAFTG